MNEEERKEKKVKMFNQVLKGEKFFYQNAIFKMEWNRTATVVKSFNAELPTGKTMKFLTTAEVEPISG